MGLGRRCRRCHGHLVDPRPKSEARLATNLGDVVRALASVEAVPLHTSRSPGRTRRRSRAPAREQRLRPFRSAGRLGGTAQSFDRLVQQIGHRLRQPQGQRPASRDSARRASSPCRLASCGRRRCPRTRKKGRLHHWGQDALERMGERAGRYVVPSEKRASLRMVKLYVRSPGDDWHGLGEARREAIAGGRSFVRIGDEGPWPGPGDVAQWGCQERGVDAVETVTNATWNVPPSLRGEPAADTGSRS